ncbi:hypothetical protein N7457_004060 [Penicillium paradoxum]|uniref:uncharacterized protein n=1 Tax=Penicillium paradoxum TaxID=176176 RepID=UPI0025485C3E|nr:uncharacterized protein N7457_004060 [Penicillium paradoxum]KAJ5782286.1 hypothetical protein N7457_004060 [Penicillium paradoxum]
MSDSCISLSGSTACPAWSSSSITTSSSLYSTFPFLRNVSNLTEFDNSLEDYVRGSYISSKYDDLLGCQGLNSSAPNDYYAQYTISVLCSSVVQSSISDCKLSTNDSLPICVDTCALWARSEQETMANTELCPKTDKDYTDLIYAELTICEKPSDALSGDCVRGSANEPDNCGFASNTIGLCTFCTSSTDSCCTESHAATRCEGVSVPTVTLPPLTPSPSATASTSHGLSGGAIAGIVIGSLVGAAILAALLAFFCIFMRRRRRETHNEAALNQPNPQRKGGSPSMQQPTSPTSYNMVPGGRVTRMSALREMPSSSPAYSRTSAAMYGSGPKYSDTSDSEGMGASPGTMSKKIPPVTGRRHGSLSSNSVLAGLDSDSSPLSAPTNQYSSPENITSGRSEQLSYFRDYYSQDEIHAGDKVAVLWAYSPRAGDEFELDRGEVLKVIGIWDDGWATGVRLPERAEDFGVTYREQRDSGVSNGSRMLGASSPLPSGEIKAFPLVCICLPQHWHKIIDGSQEDEEV